MLNPIVEILLYLSGAFALGIALGWAMWKFGAAGSAETEATDVNFWQQRFDQARAERDLAQDKISKLEHESGELKKRLKASKS